MVGEPYSYHALQRFEACTACPACSCSVWLSPPGKLVAQEPFSSSSCLRQGYLRAPHGAHRTYEFPSIRLARSHFSPFGLCAFRVAASGSSGSPVTIRPTTGFPSPAFQVVTPATTGVTQSPCDSRLVGDSVFRHDETSRMQRRYLPHHLHETSLVPILPARVYRRATLSCVPEGSGAEAFCQRMCTCIFGD